MERLHRLNEPYFGYLDVARFFIFFFPEFFSVFSYTGELLDPNVLAQAVTDDKVNIEFRNLVSWISNEIAGLGNLDERVSKDDDLNTFLLELSGFLKEIQCPYNVFMAGPVSSRLNSVQTRYLLLEFLLGELMAQKMSNVNRTKDTKKDLAITLVRICYIS